VRANRRGRAPGHPGTLPPPAQRRPAGSSERGARAPGLLRTERGPARKLGPRRAGLPQNLAHPCVLLDGLAFNSANRLRTSALHALLGGPSQRSGPPDRCGLSCSHLLEVRHSTSRPACLGDAREPWPGGLWGLGRHHAGSNFLLVTSRTRPAPSVCTTPMGLIVDDQLWTRETTWGRQGLSTGPPHRRPFSPPTTSPTHDRRPQQRLTAAQRITDHGRSPATILTPRSPLPSSTSALEHAGITSTPRQHPGPRSPTTLQVMFPKGGAWPPARAIVSCSPTSWLADRHPPPLRDHYVFSGWPFSCVEGTIHG